MSHLGRAYSAPCYLGGVLVAREVPIAPDPIGIARVLAESSEPHVALLHAGERRAGGFDRWSFIAAGPDRRSDALDPLADDDRLEPPGGWAHVPRWIGVIPYESRRSALERPAWTAADTRPASALTGAEWHRYPAVACVDHLQGRVFVVGVTREQVERLARTLRAASHAGLFAAAPFPGRSFTSPALPGGLVLSETEPAERHVERIRAAQELIRRGDLYQVNLARALRLEIQGDTPSPTQVLALYERLIRTAPTPLGACLGLENGVNVISTSPELLLRALPRDGQDELDRRTKGEPEIDASATTFGPIFTAPIKGTRPRGISAVEDEVLARELDEDPKERAELAMILDVERNDLGRVAEVGSVRIAAGPEVVTHRTIHHREALLAARVRSGLSRHAVLCSMVPSGSVTGAPKVRAMEVIAALEPRRRGLYTGGIGYASHDGGMTLSMAIRTLVLQGGEGEYLTGGGIVADSSPARELEETRWKAIQIERLIRGAGG